MAMFDLLLQQYSRPLILGSVFVAVVLVVLAIASITNNRAAITRRLANDTAAPSVAGGILSLRSNETGSAWYRLIQRIESSGLSLADTRGESLARLLADAGYESSLAPRIYTLLRIVLTLALPTLAILLVVSADPTSSVLKLYLAGGIAALFGLYFPNLWVRARAARHREELVRGFPDALDLMLVCVEAGLGVEAAFDRVGREMTLSHPRVSRLLGMIVLELRAGRSREDALRRMADRAGVDQIRSFATLLIQSDKLGSSISQTLRVYAAEMRERRRMAAQEKAHRLPVLLSIPLVACMLPVMIGVLMLPAAIRVVRELLPALGGN
jgi:tight adherence protein C